MPIYQHDTCPKYQHAAFPKYQHAAFPKYQHAAFPKYQQLDSEGRNITSSSSNSRLQYPECDICNTMQTPKLIDAFKNCLELHYGSLLGPTVDEMGFLR